MTLIREQPKALSLLSFVSMWECFSFYGMRALLVLYLVSELQYGQFEALGIYGLYTMLVELLAVVGGYCADKILGMRCAIFAGGFMIMAGHLCLALAPFSAPFFLGLALIVVGSSLFNPNLKALLGLFYDRDDSRCDAGFTTFYAGINIGGFLATILCGYAAQYFGWHVGFGLAAFGMVLGMVLLFKKVAILEDKGKAPVSVFLWKKCSLLIAALGSAAGIAWLLQHAEFTGYAAPLVAILSLGYLFLQANKRTWEEKRSMLFVLGSIVFLMIFFALNNLTGSLLTLFAANHVATLLMGITIPSSVLIAINPLTIIVLSPLVSKCLTRLTSNGLIAKKMAVAFGLLALGFAALFWGCFQLNTQMLVPVSFIFISYFFIAAGELFIAPVVYAYCSRVSPSPLKGMMMGLVTLGFSYSSFLSAKIGQNLNPQTLNDYSHFFSGAMWSACGICLGLVVYSYWKKKLVLLEKNGSTDTR